MKYLSVLIFIVVLLPEVAYTTTCVECLQLPSSDWWCVGTDCDAWEICWTPADKRMCAYAVNHPCHGPADKWACAQIDNSSTGDAEDGSIDRTDKRIIDRSIEDGEDTEKR